MNREFSGWRGFVLSPNGMNGDSGAIEEVSRIEETCSSLDSKCGDTQMNREFGGTDPTTETKRAHRRFSANCRITSNVTATPPVTGASPSSRYRMNATWPSMYRMLAPPGT